MKIIYFIGPAQVDDYHQQYKNTLDDWIIFKYRNLSFYCVIMNLLLLLYVYYTLKMKL